MEEAASKNAADGNWIYYESVQENHKSQILRISYHTGAHRYIFASIAANQLNIYDSRGGRFHIDLYATMRNRTFPDLPPYGPFTAVGWLQCPRLNTQAGEEDPLLVVGDASGHLTLVSLAWRRAITSWAAHAAAVTHLFVNGPYVLSLATSGPASSDRLAGRGVAALSTIDYDPIACRAWVRLETFAMRDGDQFEFTGCESTALTFLPSGEGFLAARRDRRLVSFFPPALRRPLPAISIAGAVSTGAGDNAPAEARPLTSPLFLLFGGLGTAVRVDVPYMLRGVIEHMIVRGKPQPLPHATTDQPPECHPDWGAHLFTLSANGQVLVSDLTALRPLWGYSVTGHLSASLSLQFPPALSRAKLDELIEVTQRARATEQPSPQPTSSASTSATRQPSGSRSPAPAAATARVAGPSASPPPTCATAATSARAPQSKRRGRPPKYARRGRERDSSCDNSGSTSNSWDDRDSASPPPKGIPPAPMGRPTSPVQSQAKADDIRQRIREATQLFLSKLPEAKRVQTVTIASRLAVSPCGNFVAVGTNNGKVILLKDGVRVALLFHPRHHTTISDIAFSPTFRDILVACGDYIAHFVPRAAYEVIQHEKWLHHIRGLKLSQVEHLYELYRHNQISSLWLRDAGTAAENEENTGDD